jgi:hypothetical protein
VVPVANVGIRLAAATSLLSGAAAIDDKVVDGDLPGWAEAASARLAAGARRRGEGLAAESGFDAGPLAGAAAAATAAEAAGSTLDDFLAPSGRAGAALFAHTALVAGRPQNQASLGRAGDAFGRLVHLLDAVTDYRADGRSGSFNPLAATGTGPAEAYLAARGLVAALRAGLADTTLVDPDLAVTLLGPVLEGAVERTFGTRSAPGRATLRTAATVMALPAILAGVLGGGRRWGRRRPDYYDPYYQSPYGGYGYRRRGPDCCDLLACNCCANMACNGCCGSDDDCCLCCW